VIVIAGWSPQRCGALVVTAMRIHTVLWQELRFRQRYLDLLVNKHVSDVFVNRSKVSQPASQQLTLGCEPFFGARTCCVLQIITALRRFLTDRNFMEVETPILAAASGGAIATPFTTHCKALDVPLYLRIAPELFLKVARRAAGGCVERTVNAVAVCCLRRSNASLAASIECLKSARCFATKASRRRTRQSSRRVSSTRRTPTSRSL
jgi:hypothetical protein